MAELGRYAVLLAFGAALWAITAGVVGARTGREAPIRSAEAAVRGAALSLTVAAGALFWLFLSRDFSVRYVAEYSSNSLSTGYTIAAFWAGHAGSLLLWAWMLALLSAVVVRQNRHKNRDLMPVVVVVLAVSVALFAALVAFSSDPFERLAFTPADGQGLNPMLQNVGQWVHPVTTYLGYVGFTVPFAFCIAALVTGQLGPRWVATVRTWTLWAWLFLTIGILFGARWAYTELGWGGYWAWDPVENASLLPWLTGTAYLHSVMIQEKKGTLRVWNVSLAVATFALSLFGTFLVRSGIVSSVHAFAQSDVGIYLLAAVVAVVAVSAVLITWRLPDLRSRGVVESVISREATFLLNNLLLVGIALAVFWGTVYPLVAQAVRGVEVSVGPPFFDTVVTPMAVALLALIGICPMIAWRKATARNLRRNFVVPLSVGLATGVVLAVLNGGRNVATVTVLSLVAFVTTTIVIEFQRGARVRRRVKGEAWAKAVQGLLSRNPRRYGGYVIHLGVVVLMLGVAIDVTYGTEHRQPMQVGDELAVGDYVLTLRTLTGENTVDKTAAIAELDVERKGSALGPVRAERAVHVNLDQPRSEVGIYSTVREDLYVILESADLATGDASIRVFVNPGVFWIWMGAMVMVVGGLIVVWPSRGGAHADELAKVAARDAATSGASPTSGGR
jgi:cytochrome c-type biogenesis protein CcmF